MPRHLIILILVSITGCTHTQLARNTVGQANSVSDIQTQQVLDNIAKFVHNPHALPHYSFANSSSADVNDSLDSNASWTFGPQALTGWMLGVRGNRGMRDAYTLTPINDPRKLETMRCAYQRSISMCCNGISESEHCPNCQSRFNKFYLGSEEEPEIQKVTWDQKTLWTVKAEENQPTGIYYKDSNSDWTELVHADIGKSHEIIYSVDCNNNYIFTLYKNGSNDKDAENALLYKNEQGDRLTIGDNGQLKPLTVVKTVASETQSSGKITSNCLYSCCWFNVGSKSDVPKDCDCQFVGEYCGTYIWVPECGRDQLTKLTLVILDIALNNSPTSRTKEVVAYYDKGRNLTTKEAASYQVSATIPIAGKIQTLNPTDPVAITSSKRNKVLANIVPLISYKKQLEDYEKQLKSKKFNKTKSGKNKLELFSNNLSKINESQIDQQLNQNLLVPNEISELKNPIYFEGLINIYAEIDETKIQNEIKHIDLILKAIENNKVELNKAEKTEDKKTGILGVELQAIGLLESYSKKLIEFKRLIAANSLLSKEIINEENAIEMSFKQEKSSIENELRNIEMLPPTQTPVPGAGFLQFEQNRRAAVGP